MADTGFVETSVKRANLFLALPPLTWFRAFEASARHLSFTAAAEELHLTQSAIGQQVKSLEIRFGVRLFQRLPRGLALTDEARRLLPEVGSALGMLAAIAGEYEPRDSASLLTVAASVSFIEWIIAPALPRLQADYPRHSPSAQDPSPASRKRLSRRSRSCGSR